MTFLRRYTHSLMILWETSVNDNVDVDQRRKSLDHNLVSLFTQPSIFFIQNPKGHNIYLKRLL